MTTTTDNDGEMYLSAIADFKDNFNEYNDKRCYTNDLPEDLWVQIFIRCSVKSLLVLTSVCKRWNLFIKDPDFLAEHRQFQKMTSENFGHFLLVHENQIDGVFNYFLFDGDSVAKASTSSVPLQPNDYIFQVSLGQRKKFDQFDINGPINGLYCLHNQQGRITILNPSTNEIGFLPLAQDYIPGEKYDEYGQLRFLYTSVIGFGTDPLDNENYKVILISGCISPDCDNMEPCTMLYTSRTNTWRCLTDKAYDVVVTLNNTYLNGSYYWKSELCNKVLVFDMSKNESFRYITTPCNGLTSNLALHNNLITLFQTKRNLNEIDIWVLLEENNWLKLKKVSISGIRGHVVSTLGFWKTGNNLLIVINDSNRHHVTQTVLYDIFTGRITNLGPRGLSSSFRAIVYHESLTSFSGDIIKYKGNDRDSLLDTAYDFLRRHPIEDENED